MTEKENCRKMVENQARCHGKYMDSGSFSVPTKPTSMCSLIIWNISKALEKNPNLDLTRTICIAHERLQRESRDDIRMTSQTPEERHLTCALLAWHQLGHSDVDGLCKFIEENCKKSVGSNSENLSDKDDIGNANKGDVPVNSINTVNKHSENIKNIDSSIFDTYSLMGPVVKLPVETKIVMRFTSPPPCQHHLKKSQQTQSDGRSQRTKKDVKNKIDDVIEPTLRLQPSPLVKEVIDSKDQFKDTRACCTDSVCVQRLAELDQAVNELRNRAANLARREAERVELLERAEAGWRDLELGYQRRLALAEEKEDDLAKQIQKSIEERNAYKDICTNLVETLKERGATAEKERERLKSLEKDVCTRACVRLRLGDEAAQGDAALAEQLCRVSELDRDLQFKEEQARRKVRSLESELQSSQCLTYEAERAMRFELSALKEQVADVSKKLLAEEDIINSIKAELEQYRQEKANIIEDLDGCKDMCDNRMKTRIDKLNQKRQELEELKERVLECQCKLPLDIAVEAKRTPSLAALCQCTPEDRLLESCSCTSLRSQLLSNLLADLFGGLQAELGTSGLIMPCGLLLCLDDRHNWDRSSAVKTNLRNFFAQLLVGELEIAIATSIEKYHAKWVGASCADKARLIPDPGEEVTEGWEQRAIDRRAQKLATKLADQLFEERAEELKQRAKEVLASGPPPCECKGQQPAVYSCLVKTPATRTAPRNGDVAPSYMRRTMHDVTNLKHQIEDLKKESIKKEDLRQMEEKITKIIQRATKFDNGPTTSKNIKCVKPSQEIRDGKLKLCDENSKNNGTAKKKDIDISNLKKNVKNSSNNHFERNDKNCKMFKRLEQSFAVNLCLCSDQEPPKQLAQRNSNIKTTRDLFTNVSGIKQTKPISNLAIKEENNQLSKSPTKTVCQSDCICFHKIPSNTSIDKLLETLSKWNGSLNEIPEDAKFSSNQVEDENKLLISGLEIIKKVNNESSKSDNHTALSFKLSKEGYDNDMTSGNALPPTTESEYLGEINLDKSNYNVCKCPVNNNIMHGDGKILPGNVAFQCINADACECKSSLLSQQLQDPHQSIISSKMNKISQAYSVVKLEKPQFKCTETETDSLNKKNSTKSVEISEDIFVQDIVRKSQLLPNNCDYFVKFLGVTLTNSVSPKPSKQDDHENGIYKTSPKVKTNNGENKFKEGSSSIKMTGSKSSKLPVNFEDCANKISREVLETNKNVCVCCNNKETTKELELNAFNLLEEHLKRKLEEFLHSSCKSSFLPPEDETELFSTILSKVKDVISESTKSLTCKSCEESANEGSWSRAYGMLQEYLKVKIKRVQCTCVSSDGNVELMLSPILEKVCNLIENDFQRLKKKWKCGNNDEKFTEKFNTISTRDTSNICNTARLTRLENKDKYTAKSDEDILFRRTSCMLHNKSCEVLESVLLNLHKSDKKVSCEFKIYGADCNCQNAFTETSVLEKDFVVNQCMDSRSLNQSNDKETLKTEPSMMVKNRIPLKENNDFYETQPKLKAKIPYIGCTLSCKSLLQNNTDKMDSIWKSLTSQKCRKKCSYIMDKVLTKVKSENNINTFSNLVSNSYRKNIYDIEVSTFDDDEDLVLKYSNHDCNSTKDTIKTFDETSAGTKNNNIDNSSSIHEYELQQLIDDSNYDIDKYDTKFLYDSLHLPTATDNLTKPFESGNIYIHDRPELEQDKCDCNMVPICHVKMLVNNIEKKLIHSKCTCDSLISQVCPVHSLEI